MFAIEKSIVQCVTATAFNNTSFELFIKRDDLIHPFVSGNKWRKLKYNLAQAINAKCEGILTFGGAYSNHLLATASACREYGLRSVGIVRGDELTPQSNPILSKCAELGMELVFVSRDEYALRDDKIYWEQCAIDFPKLFIVPEGGANYYGIIGCQEIVDDQVASFDHVFVAQGTTTTSCGLALSLPMNTTLHVVPVLKGFDALDSMRQLLRKAQIDVDYIEDMLSRVVVHEEAHFGGYGKYTQELLDQMERFFAETEIPVDPIYTGKVIAAIQDWLSRNALKDQRILFIHTGGIEGGKSIANSEGRIFA